MNYLALGIVTYSTKNTGPMESPSSFLQINHTRVIQ